MLRTQKDFQLAGVGFYCKNIAIQYIKLTDLDGFLFNKSHLNHTCSGINDKNNNVIYTIIL